MQVSEGVMQNLHWGFFFFFAVRVWGRGRGRFCFSSLMQKAALVCFLMTLQDTGFKFSRRVETDGRASWCMASGGTKTCMLKKKKQTKKHGHVFFFQQCDQDGD